MLKYNGNKWKSYLLERRNRVMKNICSIINKIEQNNSKKEPNAYRGYTWVSMADLSRQLGYSNGYVSNNIRKGKTIEEIIDDYIAGKNKKDK